MKLKALVMAIPALLAISSSAFAADGVQGETSTITFTGTIVASTCALDTTAQNKQVELGDYSTNAFAAAGATVAAKDFTIDLTGCDENSGAATIAFSGNTANDTTLSTTGGAKGVGIQILQDGAPLKLDGTTVSKPISLVSGVNPLPFSARYISLDDKVEAGGANATANFTVFYQ